MELPMFPLGSTLVPGQVIPMRVFEPRYVALVQACEADEHQFGVVLIERGSEVGGGDVRSGVGTLAVIEGLSPRVNGEYSFAAVGRSRLRVIEWLPDDPYPRADVELLEDRDPGVEGRARRTLVLGALRRVLDAARRLGYAVPELMHLGDDPMVVSWNALIAAGIGSFDVQRILETEDVIARIDAVIAALGDTAELLELRAQ